MSFKLAKLQIEASMPLDYIKDSLDKAYKAEHRDAFYTSQREDYDNVYKLKEIIQETTVFDEVLQKEVITTEVIGFDYLDDAPTYEEYKNETIVVTAYVEATYDVDGMTILTPEVLEVREAVRPYVPQLQSDVDTLVNNNKELVEYTIVKLKNDTQNKLDALTDSYPKFEKDTFWIQELEARSWNIDNTVATPFIDGLILTRGIDKQLMVDKIIANSDALKTYSSTLLGQYQASL